MKKETEKEERKKEREKKSKQHASIEAHMCYVSLGPRLLLSNEKLNGKKSKVVLNQMNWKQYKHKNRFGIGNDVFDYMLSSRSIQISNDTLLKVFGLEFWMKISQPKSTIRLILPSIYEIFFFFIFFFSFIYSFVHCFAIHFDRFKQFHCESITHTRNGMEWVEPGQHHSYRQKDEGKKNPFNDRTAAEFVEAIDIILKWKLAKRFILLQRKQQK